MSHAVLLRFKGCTQSRKISKGMKEYVKNNEECRCKLLLKPFLSAQVLRVMIPNTPVVTYVQNRAVVFVHVAWNCVYAKTPAL